MRTHITDRVDWVILYDDADRKPEMFTSEVSARATFRERQSAWSCHLFRRAAERGVRNNRTISATPCRKQATWPC